MKTPVAFFIFKRPKATQKVFEVIRQVKPETLFVVADGPRGEHIGESDCCMESRAVIEQIDWNCNVFKNYSDVNLGCGKRISSGLNWVFNQVEEAIIIEDDCILHPSFFPYAEELLEQYHHDTRIFTICAQNVQLKHSRTQYSYYFSRYNHVWGWATWRRAWQYFDFNMTLWPEAISNGLLYDVLQDDKALEAWVGPLRATYEGLIDTWDYRWTFALWMQSGLNITPSVNLVHNIGFGEGATHLKKQTKSSNAPIGSMDFPLKHPPYVLRNVVADNFTQKTVYQRSFFSKLKGAMKREIMKIGILD